MIPFLLRCWRWWTQDPDRLVSGRWLREHAQGEQSAIDSIAWDWETFKRREP